MRRAVANVALAIAVGAGLWTAWLVVAGGVDLTVGGRRLTSNEPLRPFVVASFAAAIFMWLGPGVARARSWLQAIGAWADDRVFAAMMAVVVSVVGLRYATTVAGGADSYGYVSQADLWLAGDLRIEQPWMADLPWPNAKWTATPLGYRPIEREGEWAIVPTYSPGLPLLMAAAKGLFGHAGVFWVVPLTGGVLVWATSLVGRRLGSSRVGLAGAWFVATSPIVLFMLMPPMTDVPVAAAWTVAFALALRPGRGAAFGAGLAAAAAIFIRPNLAMLAAPIGVWLAIRTRRAPAARWDLGAVVAYAAGALPGVAAIAVIYWQLYGSPLTSGYGGLGDAFGVPNIWPNLRNYVTWIAESQTVFGLVGLAAALVPLRAIWVFAADRRPLYVAASIVALVGAQYLLYLAFDVWWFVRFLLPAWPYLCLGLAAVLFLGVRHRRAAVALASIWLIVALGLYNVRTASKLAAFGAWEGERTYPDIAGVVRDATSDRTMVFTLIHSGALRYYGGRMTLRFDAFERDSLDEAVAWLQARGHTAYALLEPWEVPQFERHFAGQRAAADLAERAVLIYKGINTIGLYDLTRLADRPPREVARRDPATLRDVPPVPLPPFRLK
jgi:hypothetical protein